MADVSNSVHDKITHDGVGGLHVHLGTQAALSLCVVANSHSFELLKILLN